jgi:hypothetical protein
MAGLSTGRTVRASMPDRPAIPTATNGAQNMSLPFGEAEQTKNTSVG